jgi:starvation-inducible DNA-binding protein
MSKQKETRPNEQQAKLIAILNRRLADAIDLQLQSRQAYWNIKGPHFMALRELFDKVAQRAEEYADRIAEHIVQLGGMVEGTTHAVARRSSLDEYLLATADGQGHSNALATALIVFGRHVRYASEQATELRDAETAGLFTDIAQDIDKWLGFVETSQQA